MQGFLDLINNNEISRAELAQKLVDMQLEAGEEAMKQSQEAWDNTMTEWREQAQALPEIGGEKLNETLADIKSGLDKLGATADTYAAFDLTGAGNHPEIISILHKATAHLKEGTQPGAAASPAKGKLSQAESMFPNMNQG